MRRVFFAFFYLIASSGGRSEWPFQCPLGRLGWVIYSGPKLNILEMQIAPDKSEVPIWDQNSFF